MAKTFTFKTNEGRCTMKLHMFALLDLPLANVKKILKELFSESWRAENTQAIKDVEFYLTDIEKNGLYENPSGRFGVRKEVHEDVHFVDQWGYSIFWTAKPSRALDKRVPAVSKIFDGFLDKHGIEKRPETEAAL